LENYRAGASPSPRQRPEGVLYHGGSRTKKSPVTTLARIFRTIATDIGARPELVS
jgi:hypothetical protein